jgi:hypothetical protein
MAADPPREFGFAGRVAQRVLARELRRDVHVDVRARGEGGQRPALRVAQLQAHDALGHHALVGDLQVEKGHGKGAGPQARGLTWQP